MIARDANALASSIVLVCRKRVPTAQTALISCALKREMPEAVDKIRRASVGPVDMPQSVIEPGMGVFTRYARILEDDDTPMSVKTALALINRVWGESRTISTPISTARPRWRWPGSLLTASTLAVLASRLV